MSQFKEKLIFKIQSYESFSSIICYRTRDSLLALVFMLVSPSNCCALRNYFCDWRSCAWDLQTTVGDFIKVWFPGYQIGGNFLLVRLKSFAQVLERFELIAMDIVEGRFSWHRRWKGYKVITKNHYRWWLASFRMTFYRDLVSPTLGL